MSTAVTYQDVVELYVAMFQRAPEKEGADYWYNLATTQNLSKSALADAMFKAAVDIITSNPNYRTIYSQYNNINPDNITLTQAKDIVDKIYQTIFNKSYIDDPVGVNYWAGKIANEKMNVGYIVTKIIEAGRYLVNSTDIATKNAALSFVNKVEAAVEISKVYKTFDGNFYKFQEYIKNINQDPDTVSMAIQEAIVNSPSSFTTRIDNVTGTIEDDIFFAKLGTLNDGDTVNGGYGNDVLVAEVGNTIKPTIKNIEEITVISKDYLTNLDLINSSGNISKIKLDVSGYGGRISNIPSASPELVVTGWGDAVFTYQKSALSNTTDSIKLTLEKSTSNITIEPATGEEVESISVISKTGSGNYLNINTSSGVRSVTLSGSAPITTGTLSARGEAPFSLDMSQFKNRVSYLTVNLTNGDKSAQNVTITGSDYSVETGYHEDIAIYGSATGNVTINTGMGSDRLILNSASYGNITDKNSSVNINLGSGDDELYFSPNLTVYGNLTIDLGSGNNTISTGGVIKLVGASSYGNLSIKAETGNDSVYLSLDDAELPGNLNINLGDALRPGDEQSLDLILGNHTRAVGGNLTISTGNGADYIALSGSGTSSTVNGTANINAGSGDNRIYIRGKIVFNDNTTITTSSGNDKIYINTTGSDIKINANKKLTISTGLGNDEIDISQLKLQGTPADNTLAQVEINTGGSTTKDVVKLSSVTSNINETVIINKSYTGYVEINNFDNTTAQSDNSRDKIKLSGFTGLSLDAQDFVTFSPSTPPSDYTNTSQVLSALNNTSHTLGTDDNIIVLKQTVDSTTYSYVYYYKDIDNQGNNTGKIDSGDTLKLLAKIDKDLTTTSGQNTVVDTENFTIG